MVRRNFAHRPNVIASGCLDIAPTPLVHATILTYVNVCQTFSFKCCVGPTLFRHDFVFFNSFYEFDSPNFVLILIVIYSNMLFSFLVSFFHRTATFILRRYLYTPLFSSLFIFLYRCVIHQFRHTVLCHTQNSPLMRS